VEEKAGTLTGGIGEYILRLSSDDIVFVFDKQKKLLGICNYRS
jgi:hypothetical protein